MEFLVMEKNTFQALKIVDSFESLIWTDRYFKYGDFEVYLSVNDYFLSLLQPDRYLWLNDSEHVMIIEKIEIDTDVEKGNHLTVSGRSLESILERRIIWGQKVLTGNLQNAIHELLNENIISPTIASRQIPNFIFETSTDPAITGLTLETQFLGEDLYTAIQGLCEANKIGFKITLTDDNHLKFKLYSGADRSYDQLANPYVVFSPKFENVINSNYIQTKNSLKTATLVGGEGQGSDRKLVAVELAGSATGLDRREIFTDASSVSSKTNSGTLSPEDYNAQLAQKGNENLSQNIEVSSFEGEVDLSKMYNYGVDFFMGDILQIANEYGMEAKARVIELIHSQSLDSTDIYPTFTTV